jgi:hypothetical protein
VFRTQRRECVQSGPTKERLSRFSIRLASVESQPAHIISIVVAWRTKEARCVPVKCWEIVADNLSKAGFSWGCVSPIDFNGRTIWIADAHRGDLRRFVVRTDEKLTAFMELESADSRLRRIGLTSW